MARSARLLALLILTLAVGQPLFACPILVGQHVVDWSPVAVDGLSLPLTPSSLEFQRGRPVRIGARRLTQVWIYSSTRIEFNRLDEGGEFLASYIQGAELSQRGRIVLQTGDRVTLLASTLGETPPDASGKRLWSVPLVASAPERPDLQNASLVVSSQADRITGFQLTRGYLMRL